MTQEEVAVLHALATRGNGSTARKAKVIIAAAGTKSITDISRIAGASRVSVYDWLQRFKVGRLAGLVTTGIGELSAADMRQLEAWRASDRKQLASRAAFILDFAQTLDLQGAASRAGVSPGTAFRWRAEFRKAGISSLIPRKRVRRTVMPKVTEEEMAALSRWADAERGYAGRARVILALFEGESITEVAARVGVCKATVWYWRRAFIAHGIKGLGRKSLFWIPEEDRKCLEETRFGESAAARRAAVTLDALETGDTAGAAKRSGVKISSVRLWKRAFEERGVAGLREPRLGPPPRPERLLPLIVPLKLPIEVRFQVRGTELVVHAETTILASKWLSVALADPLANAYARTFVGRRLRASIEWPVAEANARRLTLQIQGVALAWEPGMMSVGIRKYVFVGA